jgi:hypothetical protein
VDGGVSDDGGVDGRILAVVGGIGASSSQGSGGLGPRSGCQWKPSCSVMGEQSESYGCGYSVGFGDDGVSNCVVVVS